MVRFSLSFRAICTEDTPPTPTSTLSGQISDETSSTPGNVNPPRPVTLIAGDSFAARLDSNRLAKNKKHVINIAKGGQRISDVEKSLTTFFSDNPNVYVDTLLLSIGTNDIRYCYNGISHLKGPMKHLFKTIKELSPRSKVYIQSLLPLPVIHRKVVGNVAGFNNILLNCCSFYKFYYMDVFQSFLDEYGVFRSKSLFNSSVKDVHPNNRGMGVLAKFYIFIIHNKKFNPLAI